MQKQSLLPRGQTTTDLIADALREAIIKGRFSEGEELTQEMIAAEFGVSRIPLREAMRRLEAEGLITFHANRGAIISPLSADDIKEIYELRMLIEGDLIDRAARALTANELRKAERIHLALESEENPTEQDVLNRAFHSALYTPAKRPKQQALVENLRNLVERYQNLNSSLMASTASFQQDHKKILIACRRHDGVKARTQLIKHLQHAMEIALRYLKSSSKS
jgi:DNA-binding GntR family transcriptional regulator